MVFWAWDQLLKKMKLILDRDSQDDEVLALVRIIKPQFNQLPSLHDLININSDIDWHIIYDSFIGKVSSEMTHLALMVTVLRIEASNYIS